MVWDATVVDGVTVDYAADHNEEINQIKARAPIASPTFTGEVTAPVLKLTTSPVVGALLTNADAAGHITELTSGATTTLLVGGGTGASPVWTAATGTGSPVRAGDPVLTGVPTVPILKLTTGAAVGAIPTSDATGVLSYLTPGANTTVLIGTGVSATPSWGADLPTAVTIGTGYIYRAAGTDVPVTDGGTGVSSLLDGGLVCGNATTAVEVIAAGDTTTILVGGGSGATPVWTTATGTGAPVREGSPTFTGTVTEAALKLTTGAAVGAIPTSDATGVLKYLATGSSGQLPIGSTGATPVWAGLTMGTTTARGLAVTNGAGAITLGLVKAYRTIFLSCAGGWASTTYGDGGSVTTETNATGASPVIFNLKTTLMDTTGAGSDRHHEWTAPMPVNWDGGTVTATPYIMTKGIGVADDILILGLQGAAIKHGDAASALTFANTATSSIGASAFFTLSTTAHGKLISNVGATSAAGVSTLTIGGSAAVAGGDLIQWRMNRPGYDTYASGASVFGWLITYGTLNYSDEV